jgi:hypothetical protein
MAGLSVVIREFALRNPSPDIEDKTPNGAPRAQSTKLNVQGACGVDIAMLARTYFYA